MGIKGISPVSTVWVWLHLSICIQIRSKIVPSLHGLFEVSKKINRTLAEIHKNVVVQTYLFRMNFIWIFVISRQCNKVLIVQYLDGVV